MKYACFSTWFAKCETSHTTSAMLFTVCHVINSPSSENCFYLLFLNPAGVLYSLCFAAQFISLLCTSWEVWPARWVLPVCLLCSTGDDNYSGETTYDIYMAFNCKRRFSCLSEGGEFCNVVLQKASPLTPAGMILQYTVQSAPDWTSTPQPFLLKHKQQLLEGYQQCSTVILETVGQSSSL